MRLQEGRPGGVALALARSVAPGDPLRAGRGGIPSGMERTLYYSMRHRTQLYLDEGQYRWLKQRAGEAGSIAAVVRELIDAERARRLDATADPLLSYLVAESPSEGPERTSVTSLDRDLYGR